MITNTLLTVVTAPILALISLLPTGSDLGIHAFATSLTTSSYWPHLGWPNDYIPLDTAVTCMGLILTTAAVMLVIQITLWIYHQLWGSN